MNPILIRVLLYVMGLLVLWGVMLSYHKWPLEWKNDNAPFFFRLRWVIVSWWHSNHTQDAVLFFTYTIGYLFMLTVI